MRDNTEFWCCDDLLDDIKESGFTLKEMLSIFPEINFCPYCGHKLSSI